MNDPVNPQMANFVWGTLMFLVYAAIMFYMVFCFWRTCRRMEQLERLQQFEQEDEAQWEQQQEEQEPETAKGVRQ